VLVTYNGRAFDVPLIETRYAMHRLTSSFNEGPHIDMLHPARRLWRRRVPSEGPLDEGWPPRPAEARRGRRGPDVAASCALTTLERDILGLSREDDVAGFEIPARYFHFARTGDARGLAAVFEHNRLDLLSLAAVTSVVLGMIEEGPGATRAAEECLELGRLYEMAGRVQQAAACYEHVAEGRADDGEHERGWVRVESLRRLAFRLHREQRHPEAASTWQRLLTLDPDPVTEREACEALAIYHEHRSRDLPTARQYALQALSGEDDTRRVAGLRHRLDRLDRKIHRPWGQV
jgi:tetratricopeptide (TPR) repeat protein